MRPPTVNANGGFDSNSGIHDRRRVDRLAAFVLILVVCLSAAPAQAQRGRGAGPAISVRQDPVVLDLTAQELVGPGGLSGNVDLGSETLIVSGSVVTMTLNAGTAPISDAVTKSFAGAIFRVQFGNGEAPCDAFLSVTGLVEDLLGNPGRVSSDIDPSSFVLMTFMPTEFDRRCRGNGSLLRIDYGGDFEISGIENSSRSGAYSGTITINISYL